MNILRANLKHLYQCRGLWFWYAILLCVTPGALMPAWSRVNERFVGYVILSFFAALITTSLQKEILSKPFSFCLPAHCEIPRRFIFVIGGVINMIFGLVFLAHTELKYPYVLLVICAGGFAGMIFYLLGVWGMFPMRNTIALIGLLPLVIFAGGFFELHKPLEAMIIYRPVQTIIIGLLICWLTWRWLSKEGLARRYCGQMVMGIADNWNMEKFRKYREAKVMSKSAMGRTVFADRFNRFFMTRMKVSGSFTVGQYIWGHVYMVLGRGLSSTILTPWVVMVPLFLLMGYSPVPEDGSMANFLFIIPVFGAVHLNLLPYSSILLPAGRSDKYYGAIISGFVISAVATMLLAVVSSLSVPLGPILPDIVIKGHTLGYNAMNVKYCFFTLSLIPVSLIVATLFPRGAIIRTIFVMVVMYAWMFIGIFGLFAEKLFEFGPFIVAGLIILSWAIFLMILRHICMRRCLAGNS